MSNTTAVLDDLFLDEAFEDVFVAQPEGLVEAPLKIEAEPITGTELMKEELKGVNEKYEAVIANEEAEEKAQDQASEALAPTAGTVRPKKERHHDDLIYAEQGVPYHNDPRPPRVHDLLPSEIYSVSVRRYYADLEVMPVGKRTLIRENIWVLHHGYYRYSEISRAQLQELLDKKLIKSSMVSYVFGDAVSGLSVFLKKDQEPGDKEIKEAIESFERTQNLNLNYDKNLVVEDLEDVI